MPLFLLVQCFLSNSVISTLKDANLNSSEVVFLVYKGTANFPGMICLSLLFLVFCFWAALYKHTQLSYSPM